jgi:hypothetical protein
MRPNKLRRDLETNHPDLKKKPLEFFERKLEDFKTSKGKLSHFTNISEKAIYISNLISLRIVQAGKLHTESIKCPSGQKMS